jgi:pre-mRNA-splicing helicase BRR2
MVEDADGEITLFSDSFVLRQRYVEDEHSATITVPMSEPVPPNYYIGVLADHWLHADILQTSHSPRKAPSTDGSS